MPLIVDILINNMYLDILKYFHNNAYFYAVLLDSSKITPEILLARNIIHFYGNPSEFV